MGNSGFVLFDKIAGETSFKALFPLKRVFSTKRVGHAGTLDLRASGLIIAATGRYDSLQADPANDNYHYYRGTDFDRAQTSILDRYKRINMPQGNSADSDTNPESYETAWKSTPDIEDINQDYTLNEYEKYFQYRISIRPEDMLYFFH